MSTEVTDSNQRPAHLFKPGVSGNPAGRPRGARSKLSENFILDLHSAWEAFGVSALKLCANEHPEKFCKIIADLLPKTIDLNVAVDASSFATKFRSACELLGNPEPPRPRKLLRNGPQIEHDDVG